MSAPTRPDPSVLALPRDDAARAIGVGRNSFITYVQPSIPVVKIGARRLYAVTALRAWLREHGEGPERATASVATAEDGGHT